MIDRYKLQALIGNDSQLKRFYRYIDPVGLVVGGRVTPQWTLNGRGLLYSSGMSYDTVIHRVDVETGAAAPLLDVIRTRKALAAFLDREPPGRGLPFDAVAELGDGRYQFSFEGVGYVLSTKDYTIEIENGESRTSQAMHRAARVLGVGPMNAREVPRSYRRPIWFMEPTLVWEVPSPDKNWFASLKDANIVLRAPIDDRTVPLTTDGTLDFAWDIEAPRFKISAGMEVGEHLLNPWSPDGNRLFAIKVDRRAVPDLPLVRYLKREEEVSSIKIPRAGGPMDIAHPHVIDVLSKKPRRLELGDTEDRFFTLIGWLPDGSEVLFTRHTRDFKVVDVLAGNPEDGSVRIILSEKARSFVALQHDVIYYGDNHATILQDGSGLIWRSSRTGWNHLYLYAMDGTLIRALTQGAFPVIDVVAIDREADWIYFTAHHDQDRPYDTHLCRVRFTGGNLQRLTCSDGHNVVSISPSRKAFTVINSRPDRPFRTDLHACDGRHLTTLQRADLSALEALGYVASEEFSVAAADGETQLWGVMHKPADFDPRKKYPVIDHLYGGPQITMAAHHFGFGDEYVHSRLDRALAQLGYIVISVDARGTPERSKAFQDVVYGNLGRHEIPDHAAAIRQLAARHSFIDLNRVGVWGHSWGGYFAIRALAQAPDVFHVGVASAPSTDPYDLMLYEPYLDLPIRAKEAYEYASLRWCAKHISGKLMLLAGTSDPLHYSNTLKMAHWLIQAGVDHELVVFPEGYHAIIDEQEEQYFLHKLIKHFEENLKRRADSTR